MKVMKDIKAIARTTLIILVVAIIVIAGVGIGAYIVMNPTATPTPAATATPTPAATATPTATLPEINALTVFHWFTSGGEKVAIDALFKVFMDKYPDVAVMQTPVTGGGGYTMLGIIKPLVLAGQAPDSFNMHVGYETKPYFDADLLEPIDYIWADSGLEDALPSTIMRDMCKFEGHYYVVPYNLHRANVLWYNKPLLDANGIDPSTLTTWDAFFAACDKLKAAGVAYPIQMGEAWTAAHVFEQIVASGGISFYEDWINGKVTSASDSRLLEALNTFKTYMSYVNPDHAALTWDDACSRIITGESAFNVMGDWNNGEFYVAEMVYGVDYGTAPVPGTQGMYALVMDGMQHPKGAAHPTNCDRWLMVCASKEGQDAFNPIKGSISPRTDSDTTLYGPYQLSAIADFKAATYKYPSVVHGSGAPEAFKVKLSEIISAFVTDLNVNAAASALTSYTTEIASEYTVVWSLH